MEHTYHLKRPGKAPRKVHPADLDLYFWTIRHLTGRDEPDARESLNSGGVIDHPAAKFYAREPNRIYKRRPPQ